MPALMACSPACCWPQPECSGLHGGRGRCSARRGSWFVGPGLAGVYATMCLTTPGYAGAVFGLPLLSLGLALIVVAAASPGTWLGRVPIPGVALLASMAFSL